MGDTQGQGAQQSIRSTHIGKGCSGVMNEKELLIVEVCKCLVFAVFGEIVSFQVCRCKSGRYANAAPSCIARAEASSRGDLVSRDGSVIS